MKRFALLLGAFMLSMPATGCDSGGAGSSPTEKTAASTGHPNAPSEVKEYEAKREKALAEQSAKLEAAKAAKAAKKR